MEYWNWNKCTLNMKLSSITPEVCVLVKKEEKIEKKN